MGERLPRLRLTSWVPWERRTELPGHRIPGIYALLQTDRDPQVGEADPLHERVIYIGETGLPLVDRWRQFQRATRTGRGDHSGGNTYHRMIGGDLNGLYVAAFDFDLDDPLCSAYRLFLERELILKYVLQHGRLPLCNKK